MKQSTTTASVFALFLLIVIDGMGFGMTLPVLAPLLTKTSASILGAHATLATRHIVYGIIMFLPPAAYFFGAPLVGYFSDRFGRKPILGLCLVGTFITYVLYVISFRFASLGILVIARLIGGFTTGSQAVAQAAMADVSSQKNKVLNIGVIALAMTIGLLAGPLIGGVLSNTAYISWFSTTTPFYFSAILSLFNLLLLVFYLKESKAQPDFEFNSFWISLKTFLSRKKNISILLVFLFFELGWSMYYQGIAVTAVQAFHLNGVDVGYFSTYIGLTLSFGLIFILRLVACYFDLHKIIKYSLWIGIISLIAGFFLKSLIAQIFIALPVTFMVATAYSSLITLLSNANNKQEQGLLMGASDAALSLAFAITGFLSGWLTIYSAMSPLLMAGIFMLISALVFMTKRSYFSS